MGILVISLMRFLIVEAWTYGVEKFRVRVLPVRDLKKSWNIMGFSVLVAI